jgi:hypothetical protein
MSPGLCNYSTEALILTYSLYIVDTMFLSTMLYPAGKVYNKAHTIKIPQFFL